MAISINAKALRASLPDVVKRVQKGARFTVIYRSRPAFQIVPLGDAEHAMPPLDEDPLYQSEAIGASSDGRNAADHDELLYPR
jgi:antitoxin (DNA-binding transcriptional repressor) of toxin-antitoxin stability system